MNVPSSSAGRLPRTPAACGREGGPAGREPLLGASFPRGWAGGPRFRFSPQGPTPILRTPGPQSPGHVRVCWEPRLPRQPHVLKGASLESSREPEASSAPSGEHALCREPRGLTRTRLGLPLQGQGQAQGAGVAATALLPTQGLAVPFPGRSRACRPVQDTRAARGPGAPGAGGGGRHPFPLPPASLPGCRPRASLCSAALPSASLRDCGQAAASLPHDRLSLREPESWGGCPSGLPALGSQSARRSWQNSGCAPKPGTRAGRLWWDLVRVWAASRSMSVPSLPPLPPSLSSLPLLHPLPLPS